MVLPSRAVVGRGKNPLRLLRLRSSVGDGDGATYQGAGGGGGGGIGRSHWRKVLEERTHTVGAGEGRTRSTVWVLLRPGEHVKIVRLMRSCEEEAD